MTGEHKVEQNLPETKSTPAKKHVFKTNTSFIILKENSRIYILLPQSTVFNFSSLKKIFFVSIAI